MKINIHFGLYLSVLILTLAAIYINISNDVISPYAIILLIFFPTILSLGFTINSKSYVRIFQLLLYLYVSMSYLVPLTVIGFYPDYLFTIRKYNGEIDSDIKWILAMVFDITSIQFGIIVGSVIKSRRKLVLQTINPNIAIPIGSALIIIMSVFVHVFDTGKYSDGNIVANPVAQLVDPLYIICMLIIWLNINQHIDQLKSKIHLKYLILITVYLLHTVLSGSRSGLIIIGLIYFTSWIINKNHFTIRHILTVISFFVISVLLFVAGTYFRSYGEVEILELFKGGDDIIDGVIIYITKRIGLHENLYLIANNLYNIQIYNEVGITQFILSLFDLLMPGTYFPGNYPLAALGQVWLFDYNISQIGYDWSSISVPFSAVNYLYFGPYISAIITSIIVAVYVRISVYLCTQATFPGASYFGLYLTSSFSLFFLTSMGYEYLIRLLVFAGFNFLFYSALISYKFIKSKENLGV